MNFFTTLVGTGIKDVVIQVKQDATGNITVFVTPKTIAEDSALRGLKPIHLTGTPEELDNEFFGLVTSPLQQTQTVFNNVEAFEAQLREASKATADKKAKKDADAKEKKDSSAEEGDAPTEKTVKVNNEKALKDFMTSIKGQDILLSKDKIEELYANLSEAELAKAPIKKIRTDLDAAIKKQADIQAAKDKLHGKTTETPITETTEEAKEMEVIEEPPVTEQTSNVPEFVAPVTEEPKATMKIVKETPNVDSAVGHVEAQPTPTAETVTAPPIPQTPTPVFEEVPVFQMIDTEYTREEYHSVGWTDALLVEHGKAHYATVQQQVVPEAKKLSYTFPKEFDAPEQE